MTPYVYLAALKIALMVSCGASGDKIKPSQLERNPFCSAAVWIPNLRFIHLGALPAVVVALRDA